MRRTGRQVRARRRENDQAFAHTRKIVRDRPTRPPQTSAGVQEAERAGFEPAMEVTQIGTKQIRNGAVTTSKIKKGAVTGSKLAGGAVGNSALANGAVNASKLAGDAVDSSKVRDGSLRATDVAPNTFLPANGTAADSQKLGGLPANQYVQGLGFAPVG